jgi:hypothetical protein
MQGAKLLPLMKLLLAENFQLAASPPPSAPGVPAQAPGVEVAPGTSKEGVGAGADGGPTVAAPPTPEKVRGLGDGAA